MAGDVPGPAPTEPVQRGAPGAPIALYRRYRPATFAEVRGQDHVTEPLRQALRSGRVHHAYLFSGPRGCGKTSSARILARSLNCEQGPTPDPCGKCASCVALAPTGPGSIDVIEIDAASHGGVDDARDLRERAFYAPVSGRFKIYIVDEAHMVTREGFNALLKLVEEPPPHLKFVFATTEPEKVIATIRSRTHHYPFRLMPPAVLRGLLEEILASEGVAYEPAVVPVVIRAGAGSARDALSVLDQLLAGADEAGLTYERAVALLGYTDDSLLDDVTDAFAAGDGAAVFHAVDRVVEGGHDPRRFAADLLDRFRDLIVLAAVPDAGQTGLLDVPADRLERMREQAARLGQAQLTRAAETISAGLVEMRGATSPRLLLELMCAQVLLPAPDAAAQALAARLERLERRIGTGDPDDAAPRLAHQDRQARAAPPGGPSAQAAPAAPSAQAAPGRAAGQPATGGRGGRPAAGRPGDLPVGGGPGDLPVAGGPGDQPVAGAPGGRPAGGPSGRAAAAANRVPGRSAAAAAQSASAPADQGDSVTASGAAAAAPAQSPPSPRTAPAAERPAAAAAPARPASAGSLDAGALDAGAIQERWEAIMEMVMRERKVAWILLRGASVASLSNGVLTLSFVREGDAKGFAGNGHDRVLARVLQEMFGISPQIKAVVGVASAGPAAAGRKAPGAVAAAGTEPDRRPGENARAAERRNTAAYAGSASGASGRLAGAQPAGAQPAGAQPAGAQPGGDFDADALTGADLIQRELGGQVIAETGDA